MLLQDFFFLLAKDMNPLGWVFANIPQLSGIYTSMSERRHKFFL